MARVAAVRLASLRPRATIVLADRDVDKARRRAHALGPSFAAEAVDVFEPRRLRDMLAQAQLVINATGPYLRTGRPVLEAAIDARIPYVDCSDDVASADAMLALDGLARNAGVTALIGAGIAPGVVNVVVRDLASRLDAPHSAQIAWVTGASPRRSGAEAGGRAVVEHMLHSCIGSTFTVEGGEREVIPSFRRGEVIAFPAPLGPARVYDIGHAELVTLPRFVPGIRRVRCQGAVAPAAANGVLQGLARGVEEGRLPWERAVNFLLGLERGHVTADGRALFAASAGVLRQALRGELGARDAAAFLGASLGRGVSHGGIYVRVEGSHEGRRVALRARTALAQTADEGGMDDVTGTPLAMFAHLLLEGCVSGPGVVAPEASVAPQALARLLVQAHYPGAAQLFEVERVTE